MKAPNDFNSVSIFKYFFLYLQGAQLQQVARQLGLRYCGPMQQAAGDQGQVGEHQGVVLLQGRQPHLAHAGWGWSGMIASE